MVVIDTLNRLLGDPSKKEIKRLLPLVTKIREHQSGDAMQSLKRADLPKQTELLKERIENGESIDVVLPEAFALVCRACELLQGETMTIGRQEFVWDMVPYDVQLLGGIVLHRGMIAEMKTGEGKTLVCTMPAYLNALAQKGVHVVTVNDYLAKRDAMWMGLLYETLGLKVGTIVHGLDAAQRTEAYAADITYGTNNEFGFDYLRDNMAVKKEHQVQRGLHYAIVDEVDSILVDEARTPLIISQPGDESTTKYLQYTRLVSQLTAETHFTKDEKQRTAVLTEDGIAKMEELLHVDNIYTERGFEEVHHIEQALRAHFVYQRDVDYVVKDGQIIIVDEFTGRLMPGRRYSHGLHQAIEAKENVEVQRESKTLATITFQNYFRLFTKLSGMTGTAKTEEEEFESIYKLRVIVMPTNKPLIRDDRSDVVYRTIQAKFKAIAELAKEKHAAGQPVLIGTTSIEKSEAISGLLEQEGVPHEVLNAKQHQREAEIVAQAGQKGAITIATNMAGRGTDIKLGDGVQDLGGLCIVGTERHESRRIDNQLRGRAGRQGDPGESQFFVSMDDELMRLFGGDRLKSIMTRLNVPDDVPLQNSMVTRSIEGAQKRVEGHNFDVRRHVLQYDDVMNQHRDIIYTRRGKMLDRIAQSEAGDANEGSALHQEVLDTLKREADGIVRGHCFDQDPDNWDIQQLHAELHGLDANLVTHLSVDALNDIRVPEDMSDAVATQMMRLYEQQCTQFDATTILQAEAAIILRTIDTHWMDHIDDMSHLREQVAFAGYAQRDPLIEYQDQAFQRFERLLVTIDSSIVRTLLQIDFSQFKPRELLEEAEDNLEGLATNEAEIEEELRQTGAARNTPLESDAEEVMMRHMGINNSRSGTTVVKAEPSKPAMPKVGRNDPCPCGSGKKYKKCHG